MLQSSFSSLFLVLQGFILCPLGVLAFLGYAAQQQNYARSVSETKSATQQAILRVKGNAGAGIPLCTQCPIKQQVGHVPVTAARQCKDLFLFAGDHLLVIKLHPLTVILLRPADIMAAVCAAALVRQHRYQLVPACAISITAAASAHRASAGVSGRISLATSGLVILWSDMRSDTPEYGYVHKQQGSERHL